MEFRPCIDIHNGQVKQIVGSSLRDTNDYAKENFVSDKDGAYYAGLYRDMNLKGGHVILLNSRDSEYYEATKAQAMSALSAYPKGLQIGGGIGADNAKEFIDAGASHVIVTGYVFKDGKIKYDNLEKLVKAVGKDHIVLDLSCRKRDGQYYIVTDRWQNFTDEILNVSLFEKLAQYCDEFLVHAVDSEGKSSGIDDEVLEILATAAKGSDDNDTGVEKDSDFVVTYAGGVSSLNDIIQIKEKGHKRVNVTVGSRLSLFGGNISIEEILECIR